MPTTTVRRKRWTALAAAACTLCAGPVRAQDASLERSYLAIKLLAGAGGDAQIAGEAATRDDDLAPSWGAAAQYMARIHRHFAIGGVLALQSWQTGHGNREDRDRNLVIDAGLVPAGVLPLAGGLELYLAASLAVSMEDIGDLATALDVFRADFRRDPSLVRELDQAVGFALLPVLGARIAVSRRFGMLAELGYALRWYEHDLIVWDDQEPELVRRIPFDVSLGQLTFALGAFF